jgi:hypothetical protein
MTQAKGFQIKIACLNIASLPKHIDQLQSDMKNQTNDTFE